MDKTESTVRNMLTAIEAPLYDVGVLSERGMLPGLDGISAAAVLERLSLLKYRNAHGSHIYIRPSGEHRFTALDDLSETSLARLSADGFNPCAVVETSAGNFQVWLKHPRMFPKLLGTLAAQTLAERYDADPSAADWRRFGRLPGFTNCKPKYRKSDGVVLIIIWRKNLGSYFGVSSRPGCATCLSKMSNISLRNERLRTKAQAFPFMTKTIAEASHCHLTQKYAIYHSKTYAI